MSTVDRAIKKALERAGLGPQQVPIIRRSMDAEQRFAQQLKDAEKARQSIKLDRERVKVEVFCQNCKRLSVHEQISFKGVVTITCTACGRQVVR